MKNLLYKIIPTNILCELEMMDFRRKKVHLPGLTFFEKGNGKMLKIFKILSILFFTIFFIAVNYSIFWYLSIEDTKFLPGWVFFLLLFIVVYPLIGYLLIVTAGKIALGKAFTKEILDKTGSIFFIAFSIFLTLLVILAGRLLDIPIPMKINQYGILKVSHISEIQDNFKGLVFVENANILWDNIFKTQGKTQRHKSGGGNSPYYIYTLPIKSRNSEKVILATRFFDYSIAKEKEIKRLQSRTQKTPGFLGFLIPLDECRQNPENSENPFFKNGRFDKIYCGEWSSFESLDELPNYLNRTNIFFFVAGIIHLIILSFGAFLKKDEL